MLGTRGLLGQLHKPMRFAKIRRNLLLIWHQMNALAGALWERTTFDDIMPPPFRKPSHRPTKKIKRGPGEDEGRNPNHVSRIGQVQRCSNCGAARPSKKAKTTTSSNDKGKKSQNSITKGAVKSLSQPPPHTSTKKGKAAVGVSSSQPLPSRIAPNTNPTWPSRARRAIATTSTSHQPPS
ncbi:hypothetical protein PIB30_062173 [Stylosanthes scabra]|uniref:Uncharacterized protein n=1 Tax=Stylosanthes scabra TaxID=79078 RepID=A0ABU6ZJU0_9FABA|nr:hypothetical protein [Stylosanthes scabra]